MTRRDIGLPSAEERHPVYSVNLFVFLYIGLVVWANHIEQSGGLYRTL